MPASCLPGNILLSSTNNNDTNWPECSQLAVFLKCFKNTYCHKWTKHSQNQQLYSYRKEVSPSDSGLGVYHLTLPLFLPIQLPFCQRSRKPGPAQIQDGPTSHATLIHCVSAREHHNTVGNQTYCLRPRKTHFHDFLNKRILGSSNTISLKPMFFFTKLHSSCCSSSFQPALQSCRS